MDVYHQFEKLLLGELLLLSQSGGVEAICHECGLAQTINALAEGQKASCPRCGYIITRKHRNDIARMMVFSVTALIALIFANVFTFLTLGAQGQQRSLTLFQSILVLIEQGEWFLAIIIFAVIDVLPIVFLVVLNRLLFSILNQSTSRRTILLLRVVIACRFWNMAEIYFLGVLISLVKIISLADIQLGPSFWFFALFSGAQVAAILHLDKFQLAHTIRSQVQLQEGM